MFPGCFIDDKLSEYTDYVPGFETDNVLYCIAPKRLDLAGTLETPITFSVTLNGQQVTTGGYEVIYKDSKLDYLQLAWKVYAGVFFLVLSCVVYMLVKRAHALIVPDLPPQSPDPEVPIYTKKTP